jgi:hypothetical protein
MIPFKNKPQYMKLAFTLCSINYLSQAKTLFNSLTASNPDWKFVIGLVDKNAEQADISFLNCDIVYVEELNIHGFDDMVKSYSIVELVTSVKPFYFTHLFNINPSTSKIAYFDPDILVLGPLADLEAKLDEYDIVLTPHLTTAIDDALLPTEKHIMNTGVYNLGFLAVRRSENSLQMLEWWGKKLRYECLLDLTRGLFVDQLWMNLVPAYFDKVLIDKHPGYNMAHWNLHERKLSLNNGAYEVNGEPLYFYHFSHYNPSKPDAIASFHTRFNFETRPDIADLYETYRKSLVENHYFYLIKTKCFYMKNESRKKFKRNASAFFRNNTPLGLKIKLKPVISRLMPNSTL